MIIYNFFLADMFQTIDFGPNGIWFALSFGENWYITTVVFNIK